VPEQDGLWHRSRCPRANEASCHGRPDTPANPTVTGTEPRPWSFRTSKCERIDHAEMGVLARYDNLLLENKLERVQKRVEIVSTRSVTRVSII
jgi:hypothetical protein